MVSSIAPALAECTAARLEKRTSPLSPLLNTFPNTLTPSAQAVTQLMPEALMEMLCAEPPPEACAEAVSRGTAFTRASSADFVSGNGNAAGAACPVGCGCLGATAGGATEFVATLSAVLFVGSVTSTVLAGVFVGVANAGSGAIACSPRIPPHRMPSALRAMAAAIPASTRPRRSPPEICFDDESRTAAVRDGPRSSATGAPPTRPDASCPGASSHELAASPRRQS